MACIMNYMHYMHYMQDCCLVLVSNLSFGTNSSLSESV